MLQLLKPNGKCAIVLPDGSITGDGVMLEDNLSKSNKLVKQLKKEPL